MPGHNIDRVIVAFKALELLLGLANIIHLDLAVSTSCQEPVAIHWVPPRLRDRVVMCGYRVDALATSTRVPHFDVAVLAACDDQGLERMPLTSLHVRAMVPKSEFLFRS